MVIKLGSSASSIVRRHDTSSPVLVFVAKWPEPGRAKTRLTPPFTPEQAAEFARASLLDTLDAGSMTGIRQMVAFSPASARSAFRRLLGPRTGLIPAEGRHLGEALAHAQREAFAAGHDGVALVAADTPHVDPTAYVAAFAALSVHDAVIGPSDDGGYYLLATRRPTPQLFEPLAWSTGVVADATLDRAREARLSVGFVEACRDVDTFADLVAITDVLRRTGRGVRTIEFMDRLQPVSDVSR